MKHVIYLVALCAVAHADPDLVAQGEALAKAGDYSRAIDAFKAADKQQPSTRNACMIGLAYLRREAWPQAELFLATCKERAASGDPAPDWLGAAEQQLAEKLAAANVAPVALEVTPATNARITVSSFALDESFAPPRTLHLAPGRHTFEIRAPGYDPQTKTITIADKQPIHVRIALAATSAPGAPPASKAPYIVMGTGAVVGIGALIYGLAVVRPMQNRLDATHDRSYYNYERDRFLPRRDAAFVAGGVGIAAIAVGAILRFTVFSQESATQVGFTSVAGGGLVTFALTR